MALMTKEQREGKANDRSYVKPIFSISPNSNAAKDGKHSANVFVFDGVEYENMDMVAIDRRFVYSTGSYLAKNQEDKIVKSDLYVKDTPEYKALVEKAENPWDVKISYETLVYLPALESFAIFSTKMYSKSINTSFETVEDGTVVRVTPDYHCPSWNKNGTLLAMYTVDLIDAVLNDIEDQPDYEVEVARFCNV